MHFRSGMTTPRLTSLLLATLLAVPAALAAQDSTSGKIGDVQRSADAAKKKGDGGGDEDEGGGSGFGFHFFFHLAFGVFPEDTGQGYQSYPYAAPGPFVRQRVTTSRSFGVASVTYFKDDQSTLRAEHFAVEWAGGLIRREIEFSAYSEPRPTGTDHLQMFRVSATYVPPLGAVGYLRVGGGLQVVTVGGDAATGPELELGVQLFPKRPFGVGATARVAPLTWNGGPEWGVGFVDLGATGSVFLGMFELQAGYRWTRIGVGAPFRGPTVGMRIWF